MKAVQIQKYGGSEVLEINENVSEPSLKSGQILVAVHAVSINVVDWKIRAGFLKKMAPFPFPATMGGDFAGVVTKVSDEVSDFKAGDEVYGQALLLNGGSGSFAEFVSANAMNSAKKPKNATFTEASALPLVGVSAVQGLEEHIKLRHGQKILIHGGAGGIGSTAIQLAKALGAYVITTVSTKDRDFVKKLGADEVIDYKVQKFEEILTDVDAVFDTVGGEATNKSFAVLKKGGILVSMLGQPDQELAQKHEVTAIGQNTQTHTQHLNRLTELVEAGKIKIQVDKVFPLDQVQEAFKYQEEVHPRGKVVLIVKE